MKSCLFYDDLLPYSRITVDRPIVGELAVQKIATDRVSRRYRAAGLAAGDTTTTITINFNDDRQPVGHSIGAIAYLRPRARAKIEKRDPPSFAATDLVRHRLYGADINAAPIYDSGWIASDIALGIGYHVHFPDPDGDGTFRHVEGAYFATYEFDAPSRTESPDNYVDWGGAFYGGRIDLPHVPTGPLDEGYASEQDVVRAPGSSGVIRPRLNEAIRQWSLTWSFLSIDDRSTFAALLSDVSDNEDLYVCIDMNNPQENTIRGIAETPRSQTRGRRLTVPIKITESF